MSRTFMALVPATESRGTVHVRLEIDPGVIAADLVEANPDWMPGRKVVYFGGGVKAQIIPVVTLRDPYPQKRAKRNQRKYWRQL